MKQMTIFDEFKLDKKIRLITLFSGYDSQALALKYLGVDFEHYMTCEWAVKSIQALKDIHYPNDNTDYSINFTKEQLVDKLYDLGISLNYNEPATKEQIKRQNVRQIYNNIIATNNKVNVQKTHLDLTETDKYDYITVYTFPCQDLSVAGKQQGMSRGGGTRSGMLWEVERMLKECHENNKPLPKVLVMENVIQVHGKKNKEHFDEWCNFLNSIGYINNWKNLIATDYGIPQTRKRCFMVSILNNANYEFPEKMPLQIKLKNLLEKDVNEKYFLSEKMINYVCSRMPSGDNKITTGIHMYNKGEEEIAGTICTSGGNQPTDNFLIENKDYKYDKEKGTIVKIKRGYNIEAKTQENEINYCETLGNYSKSGFGQSKIVNKNGYAPCFTENHGEVTGIIEKSLFTENNARMITEDGNVKRYINSNIIDEFKNGDCADLSFPNGYNKGPRVFKQTCPTLNTTTSNQFAVKLNEALRIRKLTPKESGRLMGVKDEDIDKLTLSDSAKFHIFGDSIVTTVLMAIFGKMLDVDYEEKINELIKELIKE